jgi:hypothetical protein
MVRFTGAEPVAFLGSVGCVSFRALAHLALCTRAIFCREAADMIRVGLYACRDSGCLEVTD